MILTNVLGASLYAFGCEEVLFKKKRKGTRTIFDNQTEEASEGLLKLIFVLLLRVTEREYIFS